MQTSINMVVPEPLPAPHILTLEVFLVEPIGAGCTPLSESRVVGKRLIRPVANQRGSDTIIVAPIAGDSLLDDGISTGDHAVLKLNFEPHDIREDRLVVVRCPAGLVIKRIHVEDGRVCLISSNANHPDLFFDSDQVLIEALVMRVDHTVYELL